MRIDSVSVVKLFDLFDHEFSLNSKERVTLLYGPNGYGKTTILRLIEAVSAGNLSLLGSIPFESLTITFDSGTALGILKNKPKSPKHKLRCVFQTSEGGRPKDVKEWIIEEDKTSPLALLRQNYPNLRQIDSDLWEDLSDGELITTTDLYRRYDIDPDSETNPEIGKWLRQVMAEVNVRFIEAQRLFRSSPRPFRPRPRFARVPLHADYTSVNNYSRQLATRIQAILGEYAERSQRLDQSFPARLLSAIQTDEQESVSDEELSNLLKGLDEKRLRLRNAGLLEKEDQMVQLPAQVKGEVKKVLRVYLADVTEKLAVFDGMLNRIELLREILDEHFAFKRVLPSRESGLKFRTAGGRNLPPSSLSSGEQHMLILIYELLFVDKKNSLILIDEPEISLHISWQLSFLSDLERIAQINHDDILIATHSPQIIGDRLDLTVELGQSQGGNVSWS
jgi:predicted ATP-binding protein involved in virulence